jgi:excinuclease ABC subunit A
MDRPNQPRPERAMNFISVRGARQHNLGNIDVDIPRNQLVVLTGLSGSGKSTLAFDTLYAEGQRRYVESLSTYARQFLERLAKPDVDAIEGLSPAIAIEQRTAGHNPRSTVGTATEIYDYLRLLYARVGVPHCHQCGHPIISQSVDQMVDRIASSVKNTKIIIFAPLVQNQPGSQKTLINKLKRDGFARVRVDGEIIDLESLVALSEATNHSIDVMIDRLIRKTGLRNRLADSLELAMSLSEGRVLVDLYAPGAEAPTSLQFSEKAVCPSCGISYPDFEPAHFSFNSPHGACPACDGLGTAVPPDPDSADKACPSCCGARLKPESRAVKIDGYAIHELAALAIDQALSFFRRLRLEGKKAFIAEKIVQKIRERLEFLRDVGVAYLALDRAVHTLSGGESQRIRLATQIGAKLTGVLYVLDEPSIGLHPRDNEKLLRILKKMRDLGNTLLVVEHDPETILAADHVIDMGPGAGVHGGQIVFAGAPQALVLSDDSLTGRYLSGRLAIPVPSRRRSGAEKCITLVGARHNNLKKITVDFPLGCMICVTGVSGSGKSSLVIETLYNALCRHLYQSKTAVGRYDQIRGLDHIDKVINIDQSPIGKTPHSNPGTYTGVFNAIRDLFSKTPEARIRGYSAGRFSFNVKGGRCESCKGDGIVKIEMHFLPDIYVPCDVCNGQRYNRETLEVRYKGKNIAEVLDMTVNQAWTYFERLGGSIRQILQTLIDVGLGYIHLGQSAPTLSGGEAQRVKLARELGKRGTGRTLYILDEPTTGLHMEDINKLLMVLNRLVDNGNTVVVIEHNLDVIKTADHVIDLGPEGGDGGGYVLAAGPPEELAFQPASYTGAFLRKYLGIT